MFCSKCGTQNTNAGKFCNNCGNGISHSDQKQTSHPQPAQAQQPIQNNNVGKSMANIERFEYKVVTIDMRKGQKRGFADIEIQLNEFGMQGWELLSSTPLTGFLTGFALQSGTTDTVKLIFKRKIH